MNIERLLEQYFEGLTTAEDEAGLRRFFTSGDVPEHLKIYKPLFVYFDSERNPSYKNRPNRNKTLLWWLSGVAASIALLAGAFYFASPQQKCPTSGNYVMIDGRCYTDETIIRSVTLKTLIEVAKDGEFLPDNHPSNVHNIVESQLKEFEFLLDN